MSAPVVPNEWAGIANLSVIVIPLVVAILFVGRKQQSISSSDEDLKGLKEKVDKINLEIYPAMRNGGVITREELDRALESMETSLKSEIGFLRKEIHSMNKAQEIDHVLLAKDIVKELQR